MMVMIMVVAVMVVIDDDDVDDDDDDDDGWQSYISKHGLQSMIRDLVFSKFTKF
jgi:hypothetical protein